MSRGTVSEEARRERARRELGRRRLVDFSEYVAPWYQAARHHRLVAEKLEQVLRYIETEGQEGIGRLMVNEPPRHGKTEQISRLFPAFVLGRLPNARVILTAYGADLAQADSAAVRGYVTGERFRALFGDRSAAEISVDISDDTRSKSQWDLADPFRGGVVAAGVGGGIVGKGAHLLIVDDPFKNRKEAESKSYRDSVLSWWTSAAYTRLEKGAAVVITHTRWHPDDLAGKLLKNMVVDPEADRWEILTLPARAYGETVYAKNEAEQKKRLMEGIYIPMADALGREAGEALWPGKYGGEALKRIEANVGMTDAREWDAQYQQLPRAIGGNFFLGSWFGIEARAPEGLLWMRYFDLALSEGKQNDYTASVALAMDRSGDVWIRDGVRGRWTWPDAMERIAALSDAEELNVVYGVETTAFQLAAFQSLMADKRFAKRTLLGIYPHADKVIRALPLQARASLGRVHLVAGEWVQEFLDEVLNFPKGEHDDQVDSATGGLQMVGEYAAILEAMAGEGTVVYEDRVSISEY